MSNYDPNADPYAYQGQAYGHGNQQNYSQVSAPAYNQQQQYVVPQYDQHNQQQQQYKDGGSDEERFVEQTKYRDAPWAVFFIVHLLAMIGICVYMFLKNRDALTEEVDGDGDSSGACFGSECEDPITLRMTGHFWVLLGIFVVGSGGMAAFWLWMIKNFAHCLIWFTLIFSASWFIVGGVVFFAQGATVPAIVMLALAAFNFLYIYLIRNRIAFATAILEIVVKVVQAHPATVFYSLASVLIQGVWMFVWVIGAVSIIYQLEDKQEVEGDGSSASGQQEGSGVSGVAYFGLLVSFFWTSQVVKNVVHVTTAGTLSTWYFLAPNAMPSNPTNKSFKRAITTSFGSICLGSLIIAIIKAVRQMVSQARRSNNGFARACAYCLIQCLESIVEYFNLYAFTQVAIYGKTYCEAAKATWQLLKSRGLDAIINDDLIGGVLTFGALIGGIVIGVIGYALANYVYHDDAAILYALMGFLLGLGMTIIAMEVVESCVAALFVCFAEDPQTLAETKPDEYAHLTGALRNFYPEASQPILGAV